MHLSTPATLAALDLNLLKTLDALLTERSVTRAGRRIGRSQPAVSNALARLRQVFDDDLLVRGPSGLTLTPRAEAIRANLSEALTLVETCLWEGRAFDAAESSGAFRVAMPDRLSLPLLPPLHASLRVQAPHLSIQVSTADRAQALRLIDEDRVDLALGWIDEPPSHIRTEFVFKEHLFCVARADHPLIAAPSLDLKQLLAFPHLVVSATGERAAIFDGQLAERGLARRAMVAVSSFSTAPFLLASSDMAAVFTERAARVFAAQPGLAIRRLPRSHSPVTTLMAWHARFTKDPRSVWLRARLREVIRSS